MNRTKRFLSGVSFAYTYQFLATLVGFWMTPFLLQQVGQHDYGLWLVGTQLLFYLGLLDLGVIALLPRETAFAVGRAGSAQEATDLPALIGQTVNVILCQMPLVVLAAITAWFLIPAEWQGLRQPICVVLLAFVLMFPLRIYGAVLHGLQDFTFLGKVGLAAYLTSTTVTIVLVYSGLGLYALAAGWAVLQLFGASASWIRLRTHFPGVLPHTLPGFNWSSARRRLKQSSWVSISQITQVLLNGTDLLIIGKLLGPLAVVPYACTGKLIGVLAHQPQLLMQLAGPALSELRTGAGRHHLFRVCTALSQAMLIISGAVFCVVLSVNQGFVGWWVGTNQYGGGMLTLLLLSNMMLRHWNTTIGYTIFCFGYERRLAVGGFLDGLVTVSGALLMAWILGPVGAPLGSIIGVCLVSLPINLSALARESGVSRLKLVQPLWPWLGRFLILSVMAGLLTRISAPENFLTLAITCAGVTLVYVAVMLPVALQSPLGAYTRPRLVLVKARFTKALGLGSPA